MHLLARWLINAVALLAAALVVPGIQLGAVQPHATRHDWLVLAVVALIFGVINAVIRPLLIILSPPLELLTLGLFTFVINAFMLLLTSGIAQRLHLGFHVAGFKSAFLGALLISVVSFVLTRVLGAR